MRSKAPKLFDNRRDWDTSAVTRLPPQVLNSSGASNPPSLTGNRYFLTRRLWNVGSTPNHFHHGKFTTIRESILAHAGEAQSSQTNFANLNSYDQGSIIEFLKTLKVLRAGTRSPIVDEHNRPIEWPPAVVH